MKPVWFGPECCDKCLSKCPEFRLKIEGCAKRAYDLDFNITQICTKSERNRAEITTPVLKEVEATQTPKEKLSMVPTVIRVGPYAIKKTGIQRLIINPEWSLKRVEMRMQVNVSTIRPECAPFLKNLFTNWNAWLQNRMSYSFKSKRNLTRLLGTGLRVLNTIDSEVLMNKLATVGNDLVKLQQPLQSSLLALSNNHWKLSKILPD